MIRKLCFYATLLLLSFAACKQPTTQPEVDDFARIQASDTLRILTLNTSTSYFLYRDQPIGYQFEMIRNFCEENDLEPKVIVANNISSLYDMLLQGDGDVVAYDMPLANEWKDSVIFCGLQQISHQVLVQRNSPADSVVKDVAHLVDKTITVMNDSKYLHRLQNLNTELGGGIKVNVFDKDTAVVEDLIRMVSQSEIDFTIADDQLAQLNQTYFGNLNIKVPVSFDQRSSWIVRKDSRVLADSLNAWFARSSSKPTYSNIVKRYFEEAKGYHKEELDGQHLVFETAPGKISPFDGFFQKYGKEYNIDWRLLASLSYYESTFKTDGKSWAGARGLMGLMPATAKSMGLDPKDLGHPESNIRVGTKYLRVLIDKFSSVEDDNERIRLALASYNAGIGHVSDARALASKHGANKNIWHGNVERYLELKHLEQYYSDPVCKAGYFRAGETINYVRNVMERWQIYKQAVQ